MNIKGICAPVRVINFLTVSRSEGRGNRKALGQQIVVAFEEIEAIYVAQAKARLAGTAL